MKKVLIWVSLGLMFLGVALFCCVGVSIDFDFARLDNMKYITNTHTIYDDFTCVVLNSVTAEIEFKPSEDGYCRVVCYEQENACHDVIAELQSGELVFDLYRCRIGDLHLNDRLIRCQFLLGVYVENFRNIKVVVVRRKQYGQDVAFLIVKALATVVVSDRCTQFAAEIFKVALCLSVGDSKSFSQALRVGIAFHCQLFVKPLNSYIGVHCASVSFVSFSSGAGIGFRYLLSFNKMVRLVPNKTKAVARQLMFSKAPVKQATGIARTQREDIHLQTFLKIIFME